MSVDQMSAGKMYDYQMSNGQIFTDQMSFGKMSVDQMSLDQMSLDQIVCWPNEYLNRGLLVKCLS